MRLFLFKSLKIENNIELSLFVDDDTAELSTDNYMKVISVLAARSPRVRTPLPSGLRTEHSVLELPPVYEDEAAVEVHFTVNLYNTLDFSVLSALPMCHVFFSDTTLIELRIMIVSTVSNQSKLTEFKNLFQ